MRAAKVLVSLIAVAATVGGSHAGSCQTYSVELSDGSLGFCTGVVDYEYFLPDGKTQQDLEKDALLSVTKGDSFAETLLVLLPGTCGNALKRAACLSNFPKCEKVDPFFFNKCLDGKCVALPTGETVCNSTATACAMEPGMVVGYPIAWTEETCAMGKFSWDSKSSKCSALVPKFPCKEQCTSIGTFDKTVSQNSFIKAACPLVSGYFFELLLQMFTKPIDAEILASVNLELGLQGCAVPSVFSNSTQYSQCKTKRFTANLLSTLQMSPNCSTTVVDNTTQSDIEVFPTLEQPNSFVPAGLARMNINYLSTPRANPDHCGPSGAQDSISCTAVAAVFGCNEKSLTLMPPIQDSFSALPESSSCQAVIGDSRNQDMALLSVISAQTAQYEVPAQQSACVAQAGDVYQTLFFVPPSPGMAPLAPKIDLGNRERPLETNFSDTCPVLTQIKETNQITSSFANLPQKPLCDKSYNSRDCIEDEVEGVFGSLPKWAPLTCRLAIEELACAQGFMKLESKQLCLIEGTALGNTPCEYLDLSKAAQENTVGFAFALPRFPSKTICSAVETECAALPQLQVNCSSVVDINECGNSEIGFWGCSSSFNGLSSFPEKAQVFANISDLPLLELYGSLLGISDSIQSAFASSVVEPTVSDVLHSGGKINETTMTELQDMYCRCPEPLVVPDNPFKSVSNVTCCDLPCFGSMYTEEQFVSFATMQVVLSGLSCLVGFYMVLSWGILKIKRQQYFTFWISFCSLQISLASFVMALRSDPQERYCKDNSTPIDISQGFSLCVLQSMWAIFFGLALCAWWMCMSVDIFRKVVYNTRNTDASKLKYHFVCWTIPTISVIFLGIGEYFGYEAPNLWCVIRADADAWVEWVSFYGIILIMYLVGTYTMARVLAFIYQHTRKMADRTSGSSGARFRAYYRTPILFVVIFSSVWINIFSFRGVVLLREERYTNEASSWISCLLLNDANGISNPSTNPAADISMLFTEQDSGVEGCGVVQPGGIPNASFYITYILVFTQSILIWFIFGLFSNLRHAWMVQFGLSKADTSNYSHENSNTNSKGRSFTDSKRSGQGTPALGLSVERANMSFNEVYGRPSQDVEEFSFEGVSAPKSLPPRAPEDDYSI